MQQFKIDMYSIYTNIHNLNNRREREREREKVPEKGTVCKYNSGNHKHNIDNVSQNSNIYEILDCIQYK